MATSPEFSDLSLDPANRTSSDPADYEHNAQCGVCGTWEDILDLVADDDAGMMRHGDCVPEADELHVWPVKAVA